MDVSLLNMCLYLYCLQTLFGLDGVNYYQVIPLYFILYFVYLQILGFFFILLNSENISHKCPPQ